MTKQYTLHKLSIRVAVAVAVGPRGGLTLLGFGWVVVIEGAPEYRIDSNILSVIQYQSLSITMTWNMPLQH